MGRDLTESLPPTVACQPLCAGGFPSIGIYCNVTHTGAGIVPPPIKKNTNGPFVNTEGN